MATGARPVLLRGAEGLSGVGILRTISDAHRVRQLLVPGSKLVVVGGGFVGLEVASTARSLGVHVTVIEREHHLMARVASQELAGFVADHLRKSGVRIVLGCTIEKLDSHEGRVKGARLSNGERLGADAVLVGIGARPNDTIAREAGIVCNNGIWVDENAHTSDHAIYAIGDCTFRPLPLFGIRARLESVASALEQARQAASAICERAPPKPEVPWFWSDQADLRIQIAGARESVFETIVRSDPANGRLAIFHLGQCGILRAVEAVNAAPEFMMGKMLIAEKRPVSPTKLRNPDIAIREVAA